MAAAVVALCVAAAVPAAAARGAPVGGDTAATSSNAAAAAVGAAAVLALLALAAIVAMCAGSKTDNSTGAASEASTPPKVCHQRKLALPLTDACMKHARAGSAWKSCACMPTLPGRLTLPSADSGVARIAYGIERTSDNPTARATAVSFLLGCGGERRQISRYVSAERRAFDVHSCGWGTGNRTHPAGAVQQAQHHQPATQFRVVRVRAHAANPNTRAYPSHRIVHANAPNTHASASAR